MAKNLPSDMPALISDSDTSDSDEDNARRPNQAPARHPVASARNNAPPTPLATRPVSSVARNHVASTATPVHSSAPRAAPAGVPASSKVAQPDKTVQNPILKSSTPSPLFEGNFAHNSGSAAAVPGASSQISHAAEGVPFRAAAYDAGTIKVFGELVSQVPALIKKLDAVEKALHLERAARQKLLSVHSKSIESIHAGCKAFADLFVQNAGTAHTLPSNVDPKNALGAVDDVAGLCARTARVHLKMESSMDLQHVSSISSVDFLVMLHSLLPVGGLPHSHLLQTFVKAMHDMHALLLEVPITVKRSEKYMRQVAQFLELAQKHPKNLSVQQLVSNDRVLECWTPPSKEFPDEVKSMFTPSDYDRAALHLMGHKFYCSLRLVSENFKVGFAMNVGIQKALEADERCVKAGIPLIFQHFGEIAFGSDDLKDAFTLFFKTIPAILKDLPWNSGHKFSQEPNVCDFRSAPLSNEIGTFCAPSLTFPRSGSNASMPMFGKFGCRVSPRATAIDYPCSEAIALLTAMICGEARRKHADFAAIDLELVNRELFQQAFHSPECALALAHVGSDSQALFFYLKSLVLFRFDFPSTPNDMQEIDPTLDMAISSAHKLLTKKAGKLGRDFGNNAEEVLTVADVLSKIPKYVPSAALFARLAFRLGHSDAKVLLLKMSRSSPNPSPDATYFLARILQKSVGSNVHDYERMYKMVEASSKDEPSYPRSIASKAKWRLVMLKWSKPVAALRIYMFLFRVKWRRKRLDPSRHSLRGLMGLVYEAELKSPYSFLHWTSPTESLVDSAALGEALPCADGTSQTSDSDDSANDVDDPISFDDSPSKGSAAIVKLPAAQTVTVHRVERIDFHEDVMKWIKRMRGDPIVDHFNLRLQAIAEGERSYSKRKALKSNAGVGSSKVIYEAKLNSGDRILYTERLYNKNHDRSIIVWCVSSHDKISVHAEKIHDAFRKFELRLAEQKGHGDLRSESGAAAEELLDETIMMDPNSNSLLRTFECSLSDLDRFISSNWEPPVKLTTHEQEIVKHPGSSLLQGRGGTGKTLCLISRLFDDFMRSMKVSRSVLESPLPPLEKLKKRILFVSYSYRNQRQVMEKVRDHARVNCVVSEDQAKEEAQALKSVESLVESNKMDRFVRDKHMQLRELLAGDDWLDRFRFRADNITSSDYYPRRVTFETFQLQLWNPIQRKLLSKHEAKDVYLLSPIVVFSNIRTFIKGGVKNVAEKIDPEQGLRPLSKEQYCAVHDNDCNVPEHLRELIYKAYLHYEDELKEKRLWDEADVDADVFAMVAYIYQRSRLERSVHHTEMLDNLHHPEALTYDRIHVDECQDMSPVQIAMLLLLCKNPKTGLFLAGDTAQSVANGVYFRFEEVNSIAWDFHKNPEFRFFDKQVHFQKQKLRCNFRSHDGILRVCDQIIKFLSRAFPKGTNTVNSWIEYGLVKGPRPDYYLCKTLVPLVILMLSNINLKVLVWDEYLQTAENLLLQSIEIARVTHPELNAELDQLLERGRNGKYARIGIHLFGIRDVKGAEFDDVVVLNFFAAQNQGEEKDASAAECWRSIPKSSEKSWKLLLQSEDAVAVSKSMDLQVELQLKMLYTAVSRCRCRLVFIESDESASGSVFFRKLREHDLVPPMSDPSEIHYDEHKGMTRVSDDWACEAVSIAQSIPDTHYRDRERTKDLVSKVKYCLEKAHAPSECLEFAQCDAYLKAIDLESSISVQSPDSVAFETACCYIEAGMFGAAADVIGAHPPRGQPPLYISKLCARMRNLTKAKANPHTKVAHAMYDKKTKKGHRIPAYAGSRGGQ